MFIERSKGKLLKKETLPSAGGERVRKAFSSFNSKILAVKINTQGSHSSYLTLIFTIIYLTNKVKTGNKLR